MSEIKTPEEIVTKHLQHIMFNKTPSDDQWAYLGEQIVKAMKDYASQFKEGIKEVPCYCFKNGAQVFCDKSCEPKEVSDEEIFKMFPKNEAGGVYNAFIDGQRNGFKKAISLSKEQGSEWISVETELPTKSGKYLFIYRENGEPTMDFFCPTTKKNDEWLKKFYSHWKIITKPKI